MRVALKVNLGPLWAIVARLKDPSIMEQIGGIMADKGVAALVSQAIADNFDQEGPGWKALKPRTIKSSVSKALGKKLKKLTDAEVTEREHLSKNWKQLSSAKHGRLTELNKKAGIRSSAKQGTEPARRILQGSGMLRNSVTHVGAAHNIYRPEPNKLIWGSDLSYAKIHNQGGIIHHPGTANGFGKPKWVKTPSGYRKQGGVKIPPHGIPIPQRQFLKLSERWREEIRAFVVDRARRLVMGALRAG